MEKDAQDKADECEQTLEAVPVDERTLSMFKDFLRNLAVPEIARRHKISPSTVYRAIRHGRWESQRDQFKRRDYYQAMREVGGEVDAEKKFERALKKMRIKTLADGRRIVDTEIRRPVPASEPFGIFPTDPRIE